MMMYSHYFKRVDVIMQMVSISNRTEILGKRDKPVVRVEKSRNLHTSQWLDHKWSMYQLCGIHTIIHISNN